MVFLAQRLAALWEVVTFRHLEPFQRLDQLRRVLAALEARLLHGDFERIHGLEVRLHVAIGQRPGRIDLL